MNFFQRRIAQFAFAAILWKWLNPETSWLQLVLYFAMAFAVWQLRAAVYHACLERLKPPIFVYCLDAGCIMLGLAVFCFLLNVRFLWWLDIPIALGVALFSFFNYRKTRNSILEAVARLREEQLRQMKEAEQAAAEQE